MSQSPSHRVPFLPVKVTILHTLLYPRLADACCLPEASKRPAFSSLLDVSGGLCLRQNAGNDVYSMFGLTYVFELLFSSSRSCKGQASWGNQFG